MVCFAQFVFSRFLDTSHTPYKRDPKHNKKSSIRREMYSVVFKHPPEIVEDVTDQTSVKSTN